MRKFFIQCLVVLTTLKKSQNIYENIFAPFDWKLLKLNSADAIIL